MTKEQQGIVLFLGLILLFFYILTSPSIFLSMSSEKINIEKLNKLGPGEILVEIDGLVKKRGIHQVPAGAKIKDILEKSGGAKVDLSTNPELLEQKIEESGHIYVAGQENEVGNVFIKPISPQKLAALSLPININRATIDELTTLPGIGPKTAQAIIEFRDKNGKFNTIEDLLQVRGLGPKKLAAIRQRITLQ